MLVLCTACAELTVPPTPVPSPSPYPTPSPTPEPKILTVCLPDEPDSLYLYGTGSLAAQHVWQAIYDGPLDSRSYAYQPIILTGIPSLANGSAAVETVTVQAGDRVLAASGEVAELSPGVTVKDDGGQRVTFDGAPILMQRMVVTFTLHHDLYWSDGALLTADDSVFSFELAANKHVIERTAGYQATDVRTVVWSGVPGFLDQAYWLNFWRPLPRHAWGHLSAVELLSADVSTRRPLGWGPFVLREWVPGDHITVVRNPIYFRASEGLPRLDEVTYRFIADPVVLARELLAGRCDVVTHDAADAVRAALPPSFPPVGGDEGKGPPNGGDEGKGPPNGGDEGKGPPNGGDEGKAPPNGGDEGKGPPNGGDEGGGNVALFTYDARWELLAFGISPGPDYNRPDFFEDVRVRQAIALCIDRQVIAQQVLGPSGRVSRGYLPPEHPLYADSVLTTWGYAPMAGQTLLATAGWYDEDGDGVREAHNIPGIASGTPFQVTYHTTGDLLRVETAQLVQTYLAGCGIQVSVETLPPQTLFAAGPEGVLFGRQFDLAQFSWRAQSDPLCDLFLSSQIPDVGRWDRPNVAGFLDDEYDTACLAALEASPGSEEYATGHADAQRIFSARLPVLPLFQRLKVTLARTPVIGLAPDPTQPSELWNIEQLDLRP